MIEISLSSQPIITTISTAQCHSYAPVGTKVVLWFFSQINNVLFYFSSQKWIKNPYNTLLFATLTHLGCLWCESCSRVVAADGLWNGVQTILEAGLHHHLVLGVVAELHLLVVLVVRGKVLILSPISHYSRFAIFIISFVNKKSISNNKTSTFDQHENTVLLGINQTSMIDQ